MGSQVSQESNVCDDPVQFALRHQVPVPVHTGVLSATIRVQVRSLSLSLGLRRDVVVSVILSFCSPADVGRLSGTDRSIHETCETDSVWTSMLAADFWQTPGPSPARGHSRTSPFMFEDFHNRSTIRPIRREVLLPKIYRNQLVRRWQGEVAFRRKQALETKMNDLHAEMNSKIQDCRKVWTGVIKRRRFLACTLWFLGLVCCLKVSRNFVTLEALRILIVVSYQTCYKLFVWALSFLAPVFLCHLLICGAKNDGQRLSRRFRLLLLTCSFIAGQLTTPAWQLVAKLLSAWFAGCCVLAFFGLAAIFTTAFLAGSAYFTLRRARSFTQEFWAVEQRDQEEASIYQSYQAEIRKCRLGLGSPPDDKPSSNCSLL